MSPVLTISAIVALWVAGLFAGAQFAKVSVLLPEFQTLYPAQSDRIAWLLTLVSIVGAVFGGLAGGFANRIGPQRLLFLSLVGAGGLSFWQASYPPFGLMAVLRVLEGVTHLGIVVTAPALIAQVSPAKWRGAAMALWSTFFGVSFALFALFGIPNLDALQVSGIFQIHGTGLFLCAGTVFWLLRKVSVEAPEPDVPQDGQPLSQSSYRSVRVIWPGVGWLFYTFTFLALLTLLPAQMPDGVRVQMTTAMSLVGIAVSLSVVPLLLLRITATGVVLAGFGLAFLLALLGPSLNVYVLSIALFAVLGMVQGGSFAAVAELNTSTHQRTLGYGAMAQTGNIGNLIGTPALLFVLGQSGGTAMLLSVAAVYALCLVILFPLSRRIARG